VSLILDSLRFAARSRPFLKPAQIERRARLVEEDFAAVQLRYQIYCRTFSVRGIQLPYSALQAPPPERLQQPSFLGNSEANGVPVSACPQGYTRTITLFRLTRTQLYGEYAITWQKPER